MQGQAEDELSPQGQVQAEKLAQQLLAEAWWPDHIYTSPLRRAMQTTQILLARLDSTHQPSVQAGLEVQIQGAEELKEIQNGVFQGLTWPEAQTFYPELCQSLEASPEWLPIPGAESLQAVCDRAKIFMQKLLTQHTNPEKIWVVTHGGLLQYLVAELLGCQQVWGLQIQPTALFEFWLDLERWRLGDQNRCNTALRQIRRFNDTLHLERSV